MRTNVDVYGQMRTFADVSYGICHNAGKSGFRFPAVDKSKADTVDNGDKRPVPTAFKVPERRLFRDKSVET